MRVFLKKITLVYFKVLRSLLLILPEKVKIFIGIIIGKILKLGSAKRRKITYDNLRKSSLDLSENRIKYIVSKSYENLGITLVELLTIDNYDFETANPKIRYSNINLINEANKKGKGVILLSAHFGNWELLAYSAGVLLNKTLNVIVKYQMNPFTDKYLRNLRQRGGNKLIDMKKAGIPIVKLLNSNSIIAMLADQRAGKNEAIETQFLGREAKSYKAPAVLSLKFDAPIIIGFAIRQPDFTYQVDLVELDHSDLEYNKNDIQILTERYNNILESAITLNPELWAWQHNRWKNND